MQNNNLSLKVEPSIQLTDENYYSNETGWQYLSVSQYKSFERCEAKTLAELKGDWNPEQDKTALIVGNYVHSYFESAESHEKFLEENQQHLFSSRKPYGLLKAFQVADDMIDRIKDEPFFNYLWDGEKEVIVQEKYLGVEWKAKIDLLNVEKGYFVDLKTSAQLDKRFFNKKYGVWVSFVEEYGYILQLAVYEKLLEKKYGKPFTGYIYAVTKQSPPDIAAIRPNASKFEFELDDLETKIERVVQVKDGQKKPKRCEKCDFCRSNKTLNNFVNTDYLIN